jgi:hypothetical protein
MKENYVALTHSILIPRKTAPLGLSSSSFAVAAAPTPP